MWITLYFHFLKFEYIFQYHLWISLGQLMLLRIVLLYFELFQEFSIFLLLSISYVLLCWENTLSDLNTYMFVMSCFQASDIFCSTEIPWCITLLGGLELSSHSHVSQVGWQYCLGLCLIAVSTIEKDASSSLTRILNFPLDFIDFCFSYCKILSLVTFVTSASLDGLKSLSVDNVWSEGWQLYWRFSCL